MVEKEIYQPQIRVERHTDNRLYSAILEQIEPQTQSDLPPKIKEAYQILLLEKGNLGTIFPAQLCKCALACLNFEPIFLHLVPVPEELVRIRESIIEAALTPTVSTNGHGRIKLSAYDLKPLSVKDWNFLRMNSFPRIAEDITEEVTLYKEV